MFVDGDTKRSYTFKEIHDTAVEFGKGLKSRWNWKKGEVLGFYTPNNIDTPVVTWGLHWAGGVASPANPTYTVDELAHQLKDCGATALVTQKPLLHVAREAAERAGIVEERILLLGDGRDETGKFAHFTQLLGTKGFFTPSKTKVDPRNDLAYLVYSSVSMARDAL
jgi:4-coumarate--CoA ligase